MPIPSVLAFERKLEVSDGVFWQIPKDNPQNRQKIEIREKAVRGTISNRLKDETLSDPAKLSQAIENPNLQTVDAAFLDFDKDTLLVTFTLKVMPFDGKPCLCNDQEFQTRLLATLTPVIQSNVIDELAHRYACNIANGRWLWRNRQNALSQNASSIKITAEYNGHEAKISDAKSLPLNDFSAPKYSNDNVKRIAEWIKTGLRGDKPVLISVSAELNMGDGQEVFPSQEMVLDKSKGNKKGEKGKILYQINGQAAMHSQKIGNAIRTIDTWYEDNNNEAAFPIAAEPYGAVTSMGKAFRSGNNSFYKLFDNWMKNNNPVVPPGNQQKYIVAVLIRGGVFGGTE